MPKFPRESLAIGRYEITESNVDSATFGLRVTRCSVCRSLLDAMRRRLAHAVPRPSRRNLPHVSDDRNHGAEVGASLACPIGLGLAAQAPASAVSPFAASVVLPSDNMA